MKQEKKEKKRMKLVCMYQLPQTPPPLDLELYSRATQEVEQNWEKGGAGAMSFALEAAGTPCLVLHGERDFAVPVGPDTIQRKLYEGMIGSNALSKVEILRKEGHQMVAAPTQAQDAWTRYLDMIVTWVRTVVSDASAGSRV